MNPTMSLGYPEWTTGTPLLGITRKGEPVWGARPREILSNRAQEKRHKARKTAKQARKRNRP